MMQLAGRQLHSRLRASPSVFNSCRGPLLQRPHVRAAAAQDDAPDRLAEVDAMKEAMELYAEAQDLSNKQVLQELMQMQLSEMQTYQEEVPSSAASGSSQAAGPRKQPAGAIRRVPATQASVKPLQSFWVEQGLSARVAQSIAQDMVASNSPYCDVSLLSNQMQRLGRVIPAPVQDMIARDWRILDATPTTVAQHFVQLVQLFPSNLDVSELACKQPKLLYCDDLVGQFESVVSKLTELHPSHSREEARSLLIEYPDLIFRMAYYMHARTLDELPIELQNIMVFTGQGLHHLHQMYSDQVSPRFF